MKVLLLDRDGTVIRDPEDERVDTENKIELFPDSMEALSFLAKHDFSIIFITNQSGIAEGRISLNDFKRINSKVIQSISSSGIKVLKTYMCPHVSEDNCECRKPKPKMIIEAIKDFQLDSASLYFIGDRKSDILAGLNAGIKSILVKTANEPVVAEEAVYTSPNFLDAVKYVASNTH